MTQTIRVEIRTDDLTIGTPGRDGRRVVTATERGRRVLTFNERTEWVSFTMSQRPADWPSVDGGAPAEWVVG